MMRIVNREEFLAMPPQTLYSKYAPCYFESFEVKMDTLPTNDWIAQQLIDSVENTGSGNFSDKLEEAELTGVSFQMDFESCGRDGCFDADQLFAVWEKDDIRSLIARLERCLIN